MLSGSFELRLKKTWNAPSHTLDDKMPEQQPMWVLTSIFPEVNDDGEVVEIIGCCTDIRYQTSIHILFFSKALRSISQQKWGEKLQATQAERARESKR